MLRNPDSEIARLKADLMRALRGDSKEHIKRRIAKRLSHYADQRARELVLYRAARPLKVSWHRVERWGIRKISKELAAATRGVVPGEFMPQNSGGLPQEAMIAAIVETGGYDRSERAAASGPAPSPAGKSQVSANKGGRRAGSALDGEKLRQWRADCERTQQQLSTQYKISVKTIQRAETGIPLTTMTQLRLAKMYSKLLRREIGQKDLEKVRTETDSN